jgi:hypothetical protein
MAAVNLWEIAMIKLSALLTARRRRPPFLAITAGLGAAAVLAAGGAASAQARTGSETAMGAAVTGTASLYQRIQGELQPGPLDREMGS